MSDEQRHRVAFGAALGLTAASVIRNGGFRAADVIWLSVALVACAAFGVRRLERRERDFAVAIGAFAVVWMARGLTAHTTTRAWSLAGFAVAFAATYLVARATTDDADRLAATRLLTIVASGVGLLSLVAWRTQSTPWALPFDGVWRLAGPFAYPNAAGLFFALALLLDARTDARRIAERVGLGVASAVALVATASRGGFLALGAGVAVRSNNRAVRIVAALVGVGVLGALLANSASVEDRVAEWSAALRMGRDNWLFGAGPERELLIHNFRGDAVARYAHNEVLQVFAGAGAVGLAALVAVIVTAFRLERGRVALAMLAVGGLIDFNWHFVGIATYAGWLAGLDVRVASRRPLRSPRPPTAPSSPTPDPSDPTLSAE